VPERGVPDILSGSPQEPERVLGVGAEMRVDSGGVDQVIDTELIVREEDLDEIDAGQEGLVVVAAAG